jgi:sphingomyelin phosphodiesterase D
MILRLITFLLVFTGIIFPVMSQADSKRAINAIAHRVLTTDGVTAALNHGANAIEIDVCAYYRSGNGWWANHDCDMPLSNAGDSIEDMFSRIRTEYLNGKSVTFVWLDIKNPNYCMVEDGQCSVLALMQLARRKLEYVGIEVIFGFFQSEGGYGWNVAKNNLNSKEGIVANGKFNAVKHTYKINSDIPKNKRMMDYGYFLMSFQFNKTLHELKLGTSNRDSQTPILQKVFTWTTTYQDTWYAEKLLGEGKVDGIIYGHRSRFYNAKNLPNDVRNVKQAAQDIIKYVKQHSSSLRMATNQDSLFGVAGMVQKE